MPGLEVFDLASDSWISVEKTSLSPATEWVIFGGRCLEKISKSRIKACLHRVTVPNFIKFKNPKDNEGEKENLEELAEAISSRRRFCFVYEQKLIDYF